MLCIRLGVCDIADCKQEYCEKADLCTACVKELHLANGRQDAPEKLLVQFSASGLLGWLRPTCFWVHAFWVLANIVTSGQLL